MLFIIGNVYFINSYSNKKTIYTAKVIDIKDGDTILIDTQTTIRLANINAPEKTSPLTEQSKKFLEQYKNKTIHVESLGLDKYGRELARIYSSSEEYINFKLVEEGFASKYLVQESELKEFSNAEKKAIFLSKGIWNHSPHYGCLSLEIDKYNEIVTLISNCQISLENFKLKDESRKTYTFPQTNSKKINLHSKQGTDNSTDLFWNSKQNIWNNDRDSVYLFDTNNNLVYYSDYGY